MIVYMYRKFVFFSQRKVTIVMYMYITLKAIISCSMYTLKIYIYNIIWLISYTYTMYDMHEYICISECIHLNITDLVLIE